ncbi:MAG TPA: hypothetical protein VF941_25000, partial [Clostridia bacterium]
GGTMNKNLSLFFENTINSIKKFLEKLEWIYINFQNSSIRAVISALFTFAISVELKFIDTNRLNIAVFLLIITFILYITFLLINIKADKDKERADKEMAASQKEIQENNFKYHREIINKQIGINHRIAVELHKAFKKIGVKPDYIPQKSDLENISYQDICILICHGLYEIIKNVTGEEGHQVSMLKKFNTSKIKKEYIKMVAFGNKSMSAPAVFKKKYYLNENGKKYYHQRIFENNINKTYILINADSIKKEFIENTDNIERDGRIQQYIGIPIYCEDNGVVSLLQIDTDIENMFGKTEKEVEDFFKPFMPYAHQLLLNYYRDKLVNCLIKKVDVYSKRCKKNNNEIGEVKP